MYLSQYLKKENITVEDDTVRNLEIFADMLIKWNSVHNLTGSDTCVSIYANIADSLFVKNVLETPDSLLDVGSGAGFPGMVLAIAWRSTQVVLCEPRAKRASFLRNVLAELNIDNVIVEKKRVENLRGKVFDMISSRAVTDVARMLDMTKHLRGEKFRYVLFKGGNIDRELKFLKNREFSFDTLRRGKRVYLFLSGTQKFRIT